MKNTHLMLGSNIWTEAFICVHESFPQYISGLGLKYRPMSALVRCIIAGRHAKILWDTQMAFRRENDTQRRHRKWQSLWQWHTQSAFRKEKWHAKETHKVTRAMTVTRKVQNRVSRGKTPHFNFLLKFVEATVCGVHIFCAYFPTDKKVLHQWHSFCRRWMCVWRVICYDTFLPFFSTFWCFLNFVAA